jgi:hypothetical protein
MRPGLDPAAGLRSDPENAPAVGTYALTDDLELGRALQHDIDLLLPIL